MIVVVNKFMKIILGSKSEGRKRMMEEMGYEFDVLVADIDEKAIRFDDPKELTINIAKAKASELKDKISEPAILITSDSVVVCNNEILEKPQNKEEARKFLEDYRYFPATVVSTVVVTNILSGKQVFDVDISTVYFSPFSEQEIIDFIKDGGVFNWAGGFGVDEDGWSEHIIKIDGCRDGVIGLPKDITKRLISEVYVL